MPSTKLRRQKGRRQRGVERRGGDFMACVRARRGRYVLDFRDQSGVRQWKTLPKGTTKKEAEEELLKQRTKVQEKEFIPRKEIPTFGEIARLWLEGKKSNAGRTGKPIKETTLHHWQNHLDAYLIPTWENVRIDKLNTQAIEAARTQWQNKNKKHPLSPATVNKLLTTTAAIFDEAIRLGKLKYNPVASLCGTTASLSPRTIRPDDGQGA